jgi:trigger factor
MKSNLITVNETRRDLTIEVPASDVDDAISRVATRLGRKARVPGFRPGKVPPDIVRRRFRTEIMEDVAEHLVAKAVGDALDERGVQPVATPDITDLILEEGKPLTFKASFDVVPDFDPGDLSAIQITRPAVTVDEEAVGQTLERLRQRAARYEAVESGVVGGGHTVVVALVRQSTDKAGAQGPEERHEQVTIELGAPANPPGFDQAVLGMSPGETRNFTLTYPETYAVPELAGATVAYTVRLKEIKQRIVPPLDDELAKDLGDESLEALRTRVRDELAREAAEASDRQVRADLLKQLAARVPFAVPASLVEREIDRRLEDFARRLIEQRIDPRQANIDWAAFREGQRQPATEAVGSAIALDQVARRDGIEATDTDLDGELQRYADQTTHSVASIRARLERDGEIGRLLVGLRRDKALAHVKDKVQITAA